MLSNSNTEFIRSLYASYEIRYVRAGRAINCDPRKRGRWWSFSSRTTKNLRCSILPGGLSLSSIGFSSEFCPSRPFPRTSQLRPLGDTAEERDALGSRGGRGIPLRTRAFLHRLCFRPADVWALRRWGFWQCSLEPCRSPDMPNSTWVQGLSRWYTGLEEFGLQAFRCGLPPAGCLQQGLGIGSASPMSSAARITSLLQMNMGSSPA